MNDVAEKLHKKAISAWCMYDWANSAFATTIMAAVLPTFYSSVAGANLTENQTTVYWDYTTSIAMALVAVMAPILGAIADSVAFARGGGRAGGQGAGCSDDREGSGGRCRRREADAR